MSFSEGTVLPVMEEFYTLQGEGCHTGKAAWFIRLGGCDIGCNWCDSRQSWNHRLFPLQQVDDIVAKALQYPAKAVVITGGEPTLYNLELLCKGLKNNGLETFIETSGAFPLTGEWDWICLSPKQQKPPVPDIFLKANELKVIIHSPDDFLWAEACRKACTPECLLFLQPEWSVHKQMTPVIVEYIKSHPEWRISIQSHKFMKIP